MPASTRPARASNPKRRQSQYYWQQVQTAPCLAVPIQINTILPGLPSGFAAYFWLWPHPLTIGSFFEDQEPSL